MRFAAVAIVVVAGTSAEAQSPDRPVTVYLHNNASVPGSVYLKAKALVSEIFSGIGVRIEWRLGQPATSSSDSVIAIELMTATPETFKPGALGYAMPYEGVHIRVFYDRIDRPLAPAGLLAHVMVHEITHVLQGTARHSASGVMKANWTWEDFVIMRCKALAFTEEDVILTHRGLNARNSGPPMSLPAS